MSRELVSSGSPYEPIYSISRAVRVGQFVSVGGTAPQDSEGKTVSPGDPAGQTRRCMEIIEESLEKAGAGLHNVIRTRALLTRIEDADIVGRTLGEYFRDIRPVGTIMQVSSFINPEWLLEIEADAVIEDN